MKNLRERTIALAGVFQAAALVHQVATRGNIDAHDLETSVKSTVTLNPNDTLGVFGALDDLQLGLQTIEHQIGEHSKPRETQIARYVISLLLLERRLAKNKSMLDTIRDRLGRVQQQIEIFGTTHDNVLANLASIYSDTISQLNPKIIVTGDQAQLTNPKQTARIRSLLLAGIRAAVLWRQTGGNRWQILLKRKGFVQEAANLLGNK